MHPSVFVILNWGPPETFPCPCGYVILVVSEVGFGWGGGLWPFDDMDGVEVLEEGGSCADAVEGGCNGADDATEALEEEDGKGVTVGPDTGPVLVCVLEVKVGGSVDLVELGGGIETFGKDGTVGTG